MTTLVCLQVLLKCHVYFWASVTKQAVHTRHALNLQVPLTKSLASGKNGTLIAQQSSAEPEQPGLAGAGMNTSTEHCVHAGVGLGLGLGESNKGWQPWHAGCLLAGNVPSYTNFN